MISSLIMLNLIIGLTSKSGNGSSQQYLTSQKTDSPAVLKDIKDIPMIHSILTAYISRKSGQLSVTRWIYLATTMPTLTILGVGIIPVYYKCKKRSAKIYMLARNRGKTMEKPGYNAIPVYTGDRDDIYIEEDNSTRHEEDSVVLTGVKQKQDHEVEAKSAFPVQHRYKLTLTTHYINLLPHFLDSVLCLIETK